MDAAKVNALGNVLIGLAILQQTNKTYVNHEVTEVTKLLEKEIGIKK